MLNIVKNTTILSPLDFIAPHSCRGCGRLGDVLCDRCKKNLLARRSNLCPNCKKLNPTGSCPNCPDLPPIYVIDQRSELIGSLIHDFKYHSIRALALPLAELLHQILPPIKGEVTIVPLPTIDSHVRTRGFDHTLLLAKKLSYFRGKNYRVNKLLVRVHNSVQVGSDRKSRLMQAANAYELNPHHQVNSNSTYLIIDDVWTTGASIRAATQKLQKAGAKKIIVALLALSV
ncbi:ComF family protein [Candidatus Saccharibacteria bacterium]|nr:ComF family protein [Candidatus Saccharibacteria bacterium]